MIPMQLSQTEAHLVVDCITLFQSIIKQGYLHTDMLEKEFNITEDKIDDVLRILTGRME